MYKLNNVEVSAEQIQALLKEHPEIMGKKDKRVAKDNIYWRLDHKGEALMSIEAGDRIDNYNWDTNQYFLTRDEAEAHKEYLLAVARVTRRIEELNGEWMPKFDGTNPNWIVVITHSTSFLISECWTYYQHPVVIPYMKSEEIANTIIKECEKDLKTIFKIK